MTAAVETTPTVRDRVWSAALATARSPDPDVDQEDYLHGQGEEWKPDAVGTGPPWFTVGEVLAAADLGEPQRRTARRTLRAMARLGWTEQHGADPERWRIGPAYTDAWWYQYGREATAGPGETDPTVRDRVWSAALHFGFIDKIPYWDLDGYEEGDDPPTGIDRDTYTWFGVGGVLTVADLPDSKRRSATRTLHAMAALGYVEQDDDRPDRWWAGPRWRDLYYYG